MSLDKFLKDFEAQGDEAIQKRKLAQEAKEKLEAENNAYLAEFKTYYVQILSPQFDKFQEKLNGKFDLSYEEPNISQINNYLAILTLTPLFENMTKEIEIQFTAEGGRRLISLSGNPKNAKGDRIGDGILIFQDTFEVFKQLDIEEHISKILDKIFIRNK